MPDGRKLVVFNGGSLGAVRLTEAAAGLAEAWQARSDVQLLIKTGPAALEDTRARLSASGGLRIARAAAYLDRMDLVYAAADLVVCRAGSATVAELAATGVPAVLVPYPYAPGDHQTHNARVLSDAGAGLLLPDAETTAGRLAELLAPLLADPVRLSAMAGAADPGPHARAAELLAAQVLRVAGSPLLPPSPPPWSWYDDRNADDDGLDRQDGPRDGRGGLHRLDAGRPAGGAGREGARLRPLQAVRGEGPPGPIPGRPGRPGGDVAGDVRDAGRVSDAVSGCDTVYHLAALIGIPYCYASPRRVRPDQRHRHANIGGGMPPPRRARASCTPPPARSTAPRIRADRREPPAAAAVALHASKIGADMMAMCSTTRSSCR